MASLLANWLQPLIDSHLPPLWRFAQELPAANSSASRIPGALGYSSLDSQPNYKIQQVILPKQNILQLRVSFTDEATECLQLLTYFKRDHGIRCDLSDGTSAIKARISKSAVQRLRQEEGLSLSNLSVGTILQVPVVTVNFEIRTDSNTVKVIKTELDINRFGVVNRDSQIYGRPKAVGTSVVYRNILGLAFHPASFRAEQKRLPLCLSISSPVSLRHGVSEASARQDGDTRSEPSSKPQNYPLDQPTRTVESEPEQDEPIPSVEMATMADTFTAASLEHWKDLSKVPRRVLLVSEDQEDLLNGNAHQDQRGDRTPTWMPAERGLYKSAPIPNKLKQSIIAQILAEQNSDRDSEDFQTPRRMSLPAMLQSAVGTPNASVLQQSEGKQAYRQRSGQGSDKENDSEDESNDEEDEPITDWEESPPRPPVTKQRTELPPDTPEQASSMPEASSPIQPSDEALFDAPVPIGTSTQASKGKAALEESRSTMQTKNARVTASSQRPRNSMPAPRLPSATPRATPQPGHGQGRFPNPLRSGSVMYRSASSHVPNIFGPSTSNRSSSIQPQNVNVKRQASGTLTPARPKKRNIDIAFGISQETPVTQDPRREIGDVKRQFLNAQSKRVISTAEPTSSRIPETQLTSVRSSAPRDPLHKPSRLSTGNIPARSDIGHGVARTIDGHGTAGASVMPVISGVRNEDSTGGSAFQTFKSAYPQYTGDSRHFGKLCKQLLAVQSTFPKILWDDFMIRHKVEYVPYATECINEGEQATSYVEFCSDYDRLYSKRILTPSMLKEAADS